MMKHAVPLLLALSLVLFAACRNNNETATDTADTAVSDTAATATHPGSPGGTALVPEVDSGTTVVVLLNENSIAVQSENIPPGPAVLTVQNGGKEVHNLFIEGPGVSRAAGDAIPEGESRTVDVTFQTGTYTLYCPVLNHREQNGEETKVTIGTAAATGTTGT